MMSDLKGQTGNFMDNSSDYTYRRNPMHERSFTILKRGEQEDNFKPVGDYTVLDINEAANLSEKKVINLISLLNGSGSTLDLGAETKSRLLYQLVPHDGPPDQTKIIFYTLEEKGISKENALLSISEGLQNGH